MNDHDDATVGRIRRHADALGGSVPPIQLVVRRARTKTWLRRASSGAAVAMVTLAVLVPLKALTGLGDQRQPKAPLSNQLMYVIDGAPNGKASEGEVVAVAVDADAARSHVVARYPFGTDIDIVVSPDGRRLYGVAWVWVSKHRTKSMLQVYDTATGNKLGQTPLPNWQGTTGFHLTNKIAIAPDGSRVWVMVDVPAHSGTGSSAGLSTFDVGEPPPKGVLGGRSTSGVLPGIIPIEGCGSAPTILPLSAHDLVVVCRQINEVRFLTVSDSGRLTGDDRLDLSTSGASVSVNPLDFGYVSQAVVSPDGGTLYAVTRDGSVFVIDVGSRTIQQKVQLPLPPGEYVAVPQVRLTPDGAVLLVGLGVGSDAIHADTILAVDTSTWEQVGQVHTDQFSAFDVSSDGLAVFTVDFDDPALREVAVPPTRNNVVLGEVASMPQAIYVAPSPQGTSQSCDPDLGYVWRTKMAPWLSSVLVRVGSPDGQTLSEGDIDDTGSALEITRAPSEVALYVHAGVPDLEHDPRPSMEKIGSSGGYDLYGSGQGKVRRFGAFTSTTWLTLGAYAETSAVASRWERDTDVRGWLDRMIAEIASKPVPTC